jgi:hypothetical protein
MLRAAATMMNGSDRLRDPADGRLPQRRNSAH